MVPRRRFALLSVLALAATLPACDRIFGPDDPPPSITQQVNVVVNTGPTAPTPSASPSVAPGGVPVPPGAVARVTLTQFGETCPAGVPASGVDRSVRVGCTKFLTCTPRTADGQDAVSVYPSLRPDYLRQSSGFQNATGTGGGADGYNLDAKGLQPGVARYECSVNGVAAAPFDLTVVP
jgi:hypothetical protein